jgi:hypothetical protein
MMTDVRGGEHALDGTGCRVQFFVAVLLDDMLLCTAELLLKRCHASS